MGHGVVDCTKIADAQKDKGEDEFSYSLALKVESNMFGKESLLLGNANKKFRKQCYYKRAAELKKGG